MGSELPVTSQSTPTVCRMLRTKMAYANYGAVRASWQSGTSSTAAFWCLKTMGPAGPDERLAHPHNCCAGRGCFQPAIE
jgi:hypothetical protein